MTERAKLKEEAKIIINSLLLSSPVGRTLQELQNDYFSETGKPLPFRALGYLSAESFLKDIPDAVSISLENGKTVLTAKSNEKTAHLVSMVAKQKIPNKMQYDVYRPQHPVRKRLNGPGPLRRMLTNHLPRPTPMVPSYIRNQLLTLFQSFPNYPDGIPLKHYNVLFKRQFKQELDYEILGFRSLEECLVSCPDIVSVETYDNEKMVIPSTGVSSAPPCYVREPSQFVSHQISRSKTTPAFHLKTANPLAKDGTERGIWEKVTNEKKSNSRTKDEKDDAFEVGKVNLDIETHDKRTEKSEAAAYAVGKGYYQKSKDASSKENLLNGEAHNPSLPKFDKEAYLEDEDGSSCDWKYTLNGSGISAVMQKEIKQLLASNPMGIWASRLPFEYQSMFKKELHVKDQGYLSVIDFADALPEIIHIRRPNPQGDWLLIDKAIATAEDQLMQIAIDNRQPFYSRMRNHCQPRASMQENENVQALQHLRGPNLPDDAVGPGMCFTDIPLPPVGEYFELYVTKVNSPGQFWFCLEEQCSRKVLDNFEYFYSSSDSDPYRFPEALLAVGQICAVIFPDDNRWHRGIITRIRSIDEVDVFYPDSGSSATVHKFKLRLLRNKYLHLPTQAIQACLSNIAPPGQVWSKQSQCRLLDMVVDKPLIGKINNINVRVVSLTLCDTTTEKDIYIADVLMEEGYAVFRLDRQPSPERLM